MPQGSVNYIAFGSPAAWQLCLHPGVRYTSGSPLTACFSRASLCQNLMPHHHVLQVQELCVVSLLQAMHKRALQTADGKPDVVSVT